MGTLTCTRPPPQAEHVGWPLLAGLGPQKDFEVSALCSARVRIVTSTSESQERCSLQTREKLQGLDPLQGLSNPRALGPFPFHTLEWSGLGPGRGRECQAAFGEGHEANTATWPEPPRPCHLLTFCLHLPPHSFSALPACCALVSSLPPVPCLFLPFLGISRSPSFSLLLG